MLGPNIRLPNIYHTNRLHLMGRKVTTPVSFQQLLPRNVTTEHSGLDPIEEHQDSVPGYNSCQYVKLNLKSVLQCNLLLKHMLKYALRQKKYVS